MREGASAVRVALLHGIDLVCSLMFCSRTRTGTQRTDTSRSRMCQTSFISIPFLNLPDKLHKSVICQMPIVFFFLPLNGEAGSCRQDAHRAGGEALRLWRSSAAVAGAQGMVLKGWKPKLKLHDILREMGRIWLIWAEVWKLLPWKGRPEQGVDPNRPPKCYVAPGLGSLTGLGDQPYVRLDRCVRQFLVGSWSPEVLCGSCAATLACSSRDQAAAFLEGVDEGPGCQIAVNAAGRVQGIPQFVRWGPAT